MIYILVLSLFILLFVAYRCLGQDIASPSIHFVIGFSICSCVCLFYQEEWDMDSLHIGTYSLIFGSTCVFFLVEYTYKKLFLKKEIMEVKERGLAKPINSWKLLFLLLLQLYSYYMMAKFTMSVSSGSDSLGEALADVDQRSKYEGESFYAPWYVNIPNTFCQCLGYVCCCLLPYYYIMCPKQYNKEKILLTLNLMLTIVGSLLTGSRGNLVTYLIPTAIFFVIAFKKKNGMKASIPKKVKIAFVSFAVVFALSFMALGSLIGRELNTDITPQYMFAVYCGAQIKNLDDYLYGEQIKEEKTFGANVFYGIRRNIAQRTGDKVARSANNTVEFNVVNGNFMGNVRSALVVYYVDFRWAGLLCVALFSFIMSKLYYGIYRSDFLRNGRLNYWMLFYAWLAFSPFLSFFGEKFYSKFSIDGLVRFSISWLFIIVFLQGGKAAYNRQLKTRNAK